MKVEINDWTQFDGLNYPPQFGWYLVTTRRGIVRPLKYWVKGEKVWVNNVVAWVEYPAPYQEAKDLEMV